MSAGRGFRASRCERANVRGRSTAEGRIERASWSTRDLRAPAQIRACHCEVSCLISAAPNAPVAQLDRAPDYESGGRGFKSCPVRQPFSCRCKFHTRRLPADRSRHRAGAGMRPKSGFAQRALRFLPQLHVGLRLTSSTTSGPHAQIYAGPPKYSLNKDLQQTAKQKTQRVFDVIKNVPGCIVESWMQPKMYIPSDIHR